MEGTGVNGRVKVPLNGLLKGGKVCNGDATGVGVSGWVSSGCSLCCGGSAEGVSCSVAISSTTGCRRVEASSGGSSVIVTVEVLLLAYEKPDCK